MVAGFPTTLDGLRRESGPWAAFRQTAYKLEQSIFRYVLLDGTSVEAMAQNVNLARAVTVRFGSQGELVRSMQAVLRDLGLISFVPDANCGPLTQMAIIRFQIDRMGAENADGILGGNTAVQLGLKDWPTEGKKRPIALNGKPFVLDTGAGAGVKPKGAEAFRFRGDYKLPKYAIEHFNAAAGVPWDCAEPVRDWNEYSGCVRDSGYAFPSAPVPAFFYEAKFAIDADGVAPAAGGEPTGQANTTLHDRNNRALDSQNYPFIVLPLNQQTRRGKIEKFPAERLRKWARRSVISACSFSRPVKSCRFFTAISAQRSNSEKARCWRPAPSGSTTIPCAAESTKGKFRPGSSTSFFPGARTRRTGSRNERPRTWPAMRWPCLRNSALRSSCGSQSAWTCRCRKKSAAKNGA